MIIKELVDKYLSSGHSYRNAQNLAAEEIIIKKIATSPFSSHVTLKGGIVMFNLTKSIRRVTQDIDFDLIRYSIDDQSIELFIKKLDAIDDGISCSIVGQIEQLHQEDYHGVRVNLLLKDQNNAKLNIKLDIGVHTYSAIKQDNAIFAFSNSEDSVTINVNPCEQIISEKLLSLARLGPISTRYKDIYDIYYLITKNLVNINKTKEILSLFISSSKRKPNDIGELTNSIIDTLNNKSFANDAKKSTSLWIDVDYDIVKEVITNFLIKI